MTPRIVRIYSHENESNIIGFSASCSAIPEDVRFKKFMADRDYELVDPAVEKPEGACSYRYASVKPPISSEHLRELGEFCLDFVRTFEHGIEVIDSRDASPDDYHKKSILIAKS